MLPKLLVPVKRAFDRRPRVIYVTTADHGYTTRNLIGPLAERGVTLQPMSWEYLFATRFPPRAAYVLTDFDRLGPAEMQAAARIHDRLASLGLPVLNQARNFRPRPALIKALHQAGINSYSCTLPAHGEVQRRFPCFLRTIAGHRGIMGDLIHTPAELEEKIAAALKRGHLLSVLMVGDYCAEPDERGTFKKYAAFVLGSRIQRANMVTDASFKAKHGVVALGTEAHYARERAELDSYPRAALMAEVAKIAGMEFGRIDYGIVAGRPEIYEFNTNPELTIRLRHPSATRLESLAIIRGSLLDFLADLAISPRGRRPSLRGAFRARGPWPRRVRRR